MNTEENGRRRQDTGKIEKRSMYRNLSITGIILLSVILMLVACEPAGFLFSEEGNIECGGDGKAIILDNNPEAIDPTYDELIAFINNDPTDNKEYIEDGPNAYIGQGLFSSAWRKDVKGFDGNPSFTEFDFAVLYRE